MEQLSRAVTQAYFPHELTAIGGREVSSSQVTLDTLDLGPVLVGHVGWGVDVQVDCDYPNAYEINIPLRGHLESRGRHGTITSAAGQATVFRANTPTLISKWEANCVVIGVKFDSSWLDREAERVLGRDVARVGAILPDRLELDHGTASEWRRLVSSLAGQLCEPGVFSSLPTVRQQLAGALADAFLLASCPESGTAPVPRPRAISKIVDTIHDDPARPWTVGQMAVLGGMSARRLQEAFRRWLGCAPLDYLIQVRLQRAHSDLANDPTETISNIAARWGFSSASRFAAAYRKRYGNSPSQHRS
jgi:AraC-like DNA-binding protein